MKGLLMRNENSIWRKKKLQNSILSKLITQIQLKKFISCKKSLPPFLSPPFQRTKRNPNSRVSELKKPKKKPTFGTRRAALCLAAAAAVATVAISPPRPPTPLQNPQLQNFTTSKSRGTTPTTNHGKKRTKEMKMSRADL
jgi:hypothetical protein